MTVTLPADITARAASMDDLQALIALANACSLADNGRADTVAGHILDMWEDTDLATDSVVLVTSAGQIIG